ncbi:uncharacterized protein DNG_09795 [Cephalotrichum gorgonifer]|uniref:NACHT-NTPase and P-loop NTPases N-terminal domain-containing protein n=1 Tax=Cephalotrichum gorgonifer TaxID=2041049 RepID=A0AAE8N6D5_9PEZI|nr:uncharacterized protein DNG_09795 [Cephalotrichum gorgonifer]
MSGFEAVGAISAIITIVESCIKIYEGARDASGVPTSLRDAAARLPLIKATLTMARDDLASGPWSQGTDDAIRGVLDSCEDKAADLKTIFQSIAPGPLSRSRTGGMRKYYRSLRALMESDNVDSLMDGMIADLQVLTASHSVKGATREQVAELLEAARDKSEHAGRPAAGGMMGRSMTFHNTGSGSQIVHNGNGDIRLSTGSGMNCSGNIETLNLSFSPTF